MAQFDAGNYIDVQERITRFWSEYPDGSIVTRLMSPPDDFSQCRYEATVYRHRDDQRPSATGYAFELAAPGTKGPNATSHEENCETSAIGRALANMGYATTRQDRPSRQETSKVERGPQASPAPRGNAPPDGSGNGDRPLGWNELWAFARTKGYARREPLEAFIGPFGDDEPARIMERFRAALSGQTG